MTLDPNLITLWAIAAAVNQLQQAKIDYLQIENQVQREFIRDKIGSKRILLTDNQRRRLAVVGKSLGRRQLGELQTIFTPDTILSWHRKLVAQKWTRASNSPRRPKIEQAVVDLVVRLAGENPNWGCDRIAGELKKLGHRLSDTSVENVLKEHGIEPSPRRKPNSSWSEFLKAHWESLAAIDFTTVEVWRPTGLQTVYLLFVMQLATRRVQFLGSTANPNETWMLQAAERVTAVGGLLGGRDHPTILIMDNDTKFTATFKQKLIACGVQPKLTAHRAPNMNAYTERFMRSYKSELVHRMIFFGKRMLDYATEQYLIHYHSERPHQGLGNELIIPLSRPPDGKGPVEVNKRLGGLLKSYTRAAA